MVIRIHTTITLLIMSTDASTRSQLRLLQFLSPVAPVGTYSYSQGIEWAVNENWIQDESSFALWIQEQISSVLTEQELPLLMRLYRSVADNDIDSAEYWSQFSIAVRETAELRQEERNRAEAYLRVLESIETIDSRWPRSMFLKTPLASMAWFCVRQEISEHALLTAYAHNWLESSLVTGIKVIPLGQSAGQRLLFTLAAELVTAIERSQTISDEAIGIALPALSMASCGHETQYTRIYRS